MGNHQQLADFLQERLAKHGAQAELARKMGISRYTLNAWVRGENRPRPDMCIVLARHLGVSPEYVLEIAGYADEVQEFGALTTGRMASPENRIAVIGTVYGGRVDLEFDPTDQGFPVGGGLEHVYVDGAAEGDYALRVEGDSMEPLAPAGAIVVVTPRQKLNENGLAVVRHNDGRCWLKKVIRHTDTYTLLSYNPTETPFVLRVGEVRYIHKVLWIKMP